MSSSKITENVIGSISKGPLVIFVLLGLGIWQSSKMTTAQINTIEKLVSVLSNPVGVAIFILIMSGLLYALIWPVGKFFAAAAREFLILSQLHENNAVVHYEASKKMYADIAVLKAEITRLTDKITEFYDGHD